MSQRIGHPMSTTLTNADRAALNEAWRRIREALATTLDELAGAFRNVMVALAPVFARLRAFVDALERRAFEERQERRRRRQAGPTRGQRIRTEYRRR